MNNNNNNNEETPQKPLYYYKDNTSHVQTLKNNEDLQVFKKPTFTTRYFTEFENSSKKTFDSEKIKQKSLFFTISGFISNLTLIKAFKKGLDMVSLRGFQKENEKSFKTTKFRTFYRLWKVFVYFIGCFSYFIINIERNCENWMIFELFFLFNELLVLFYKFFKKRKRILSNLFKLSVKLAIWLVFVGGLWLFGFKMIVFNLLRLFRVKRFLVLVKEKLLFPVYYQKKAFFHLRNKENGYFHVEIALYEGISLYITLIFAITHVFLLFNEEEKEFLEILNEFLLLSRFSSFEGMNIKNLVILCFLMIFCLFIDPFFKKKEVFEENHLFFMIFESIPFKKIDCFIKNNTNLVKNHDIIILYHNKTTKISHFNPKSTELTEFLINPPTKLNSLLKYYLSNSEKILLFIGESHNTLKPFFSYQKIKKALKKQVISIYYEGKHNISPNLSNFPSSPLKSHYIFTSFLINGYNLLIKEVFSKNGLKIGKANIPSIMEELKYRDIFKILLFSSEIPSKPLILIGVCPYSSNKQFIKGNLMNYALKAKDELYFLSNNIEIHQKWIESFSRGDLNNFHTIERDFNLKMSLEMEDLLQKEHFYERRTEFSTFSNTQSKTGNYPLIINLFKTEQKAYKLINLPYYVIFINDQIQALEFINMVKRYKKITVKVFCEGGIEKNIVESLINMRDYCCFFIGDWRNEGHLGYLDIENADRILIHRSVNRFRGKEFEVMFLLRKLSNCYDIKGKIHFYIDCERGCNVGLQGIGDNIHIFDDLEMFEMFLQGSLDGVLMDFIKYFLLDSKGDSLLFFIVRINRFFIEVFKVMGLFIWKMLQIQAGFPLVAIRQSEKEGIKLVIMLDLKEKLVLNDEILFFTSSSPYSKEKRQLESINHSGISLMKENNNEVILNFNAFEEEKEKGLISAEKIKLKIIEKDILINALKYTIQAYKG